VRFGLNALYNKLVVERSGNVGVERRRGSASTVVVGVFEAPEEAAADGAKEDAVDDEEKRVREEDDEVMSHIRRLRALHAPGRRRCSDVSGSGEE
jgi:hypothetical protein